MLCLTDILKRVNYGEIALQDKYISMHVYIDTDKYAIKLIQKIHNFSFSVQFVTIAQ